MGGRLGGRRGHSAAIAFGYKAYVSVNLAASKELAPFRVLVPDGDGEGAVAGARRGPSRGLSSQICRKEPESASRFILVNKRNAPGERMPDQAEQAYAEWLRANPAPNFADLIARHGGYDAIPPLSGRHLPMRNVNGTPSARARRRGRTVRIIGGGHAETDRQ